MLSIMWISDEISLKSNLRLVLTKVWISENSFEVIWDLVILDRGDAIGDIYEDICFSSFAEGQDDVLYPDLMSVEYFDVFPKS